MPGCLLHACSFASHTVVAPRLLHLTAAFPSCMHLLNPMNFLKAVSICGLVLFFVTICSSIVSLYYFAVGRTSHRKIFVSFPFVLQTLCAICAVIGLSTNIALVKLQGDPSQFEPILHIAIFIAVAFIITDSLRHVSFARTIRSQRLTS